MFFLSLTKNFAGNKPPGARVWTGKCGGFEVCFVSDTCRIEKKDTVTEIILPAVEAESMPLLTLKIDQEYKRVELRKSTDGGLRVYFHLSESGEFFAATNIFLLREGAVALNENRQALAEYFIYRCVMPPRTLFRGIQCMLHGGKLVVAASGSSCAVIQNRAVEFLYGADPGISREPFDEQVGALVELLKKKLRPAAGSRETIAMLMSGGIDSTILSALAKQEYGINNTFSTSFPFEIPSLDMERKYALSAARALEFRHVHFTGSSREYCEALVRAVHKLGEPVHHLQSPCMDLLMRHLVVDGKSMLIQGLGAGGVFGNFRNHLYLRDKPVWQIINSLPVRFCLGCMNQLIGRGGTLLGKLEDMAQTVPLESTGHPLWRWHIQGDVKWACDRYQTTMEAVIAPHLRIIEEIDPPDVYSLWARYALIGEEDVTLSINSGLAEADQMSLSTPFYDEDIIRAALAVSWKEKMRSPENSLRKAMAERSGVPRFVRDRRKTGFGIKRRDWAKPGGVFEPFIPIVERYFDSSEVKALRNGGYASSMTFWCVVNYSLWKALVIDNEPLADVLSEVAECETKLCRKDNNA